MMKRSWLWWAPAAFLVGAVIFGLLDSGPSGRADSAFSAALLRERQDRYREFVKLDDRGRGRVIAGEAVEASGGMAPLESIEDLIKVSESRIKSSGDGEKLVRTKIFYRRGGKIRVDERIDFVSKTFLPRLNISRGFDGSRAWTAQSGDVKEASSGEIEPYLKNLYGPAEMLRLALGAGFSIRYIGNKSVQAERCAILALLNDKEGLLVAAVFVNSGSHSILGLERTIELGGNLAGTYARQQVNYFRYTDTAIAKVPFKVVDTIRGSSYTEDATVEVVSLDVNTSFDDGIFEKP